MRAPAATPAQLPVGHRPAHEVEKRPARNGLWTGCSRMSARIAPESIAAVSPAFAGYRSTAVTAAVTEAAALSASGDATKAQSGDQIALKSSSSDSAAIELPGEENAAPAPVTPPPEPSGAAYVWAVISGAISPRPTS